MRQASVRLPLLALRAIVGRGLAILVAVLLLAFTGVANAQVTEEKHAFAQVYARFDAMLLDIGVNGEELRELTLKCEVTGLSPDGLYWNSQGALQYIIGKTSELAYKRSMSAPWVTTAEVDYVEAQYAQWNDLVVRAKQRLTALLPTCAQLAVLFAHVNDSSEASVAFSNALAAATPDIEAIAALLNTSLFAGIDAIATGEVRIASLTVSYKHWLEANQALRDAFLVAEREVERRSTAVTIAAQRLEAASQAVKAPLDAVGALREKARYFADKYAEALPAKDRTPEYQRLEVQYVAGEARMRRILELFRQYNAKEIDLPVTSVDNLLAEQKTLEVAQAKRAARMRQIETDAGYSSNHDYYAAQLEEMDTQPRGHQGGRARAVGPAEGSIADDRERSAGGDPEGANGT